jgi:hypothetical protein
VKKHLPAILCVAGSLAAPVLAHHSVAGQFDVGKVVTLSGRFVQVDWINPHTQLYLQVTDSGGAAVTWKIESLPVAMMRKAGVSKQDLLADGKPVKVLLHPARDGTPALGYALRVEFADGRSFELSRTPDGAVFLP